jgi:hypothetical protein
MPKEVQTTSFQYEEPVHCVSGNDRTVHHETTMGQTVY